MGAPEAKKHISFGDEINGGFRKPPVTMKNEDRDDFYDPTQVLNVPNKPLRPPVPAFNMDDAT